MVLGAMGSCYRGYAQMHDAACRRPKDSDIQGRINTKGVDSSAYFICAEHGHNFQFPRSCCHQELKGRTSRLWLGNCTFTRNFRVWHLVFQALRAAAIAWKLLPCLCTNNNLARHRVGDSQTQYHNLSALKGEEYLGLL